MRQVLGDSWTAEVDDSFSRRMTDDGWTVFERVGMALCFVVYGQMPLDPRRALESIDDRQIEGYEAVRTDLSFEQAGEAAAAKAVLHRKIDMEWDHNGAEESRWMLRAQVASMGTMMNMRAFFDKEEETGIAVAAWQSLRWRTRPKTRRI